MAYKQHDLFETPSHDVKIWKYLDLAKFISLIDSQSLYFTRLDILQQEDPYEGSYAQQNLKYPHRTGFQRLACVVG